MPRSFPSRPVLAGLLVLAAGPALAQGTPRSVGECERLKNDLAYNQCLAMFGPAARNVAGGFAAVDASAVPQAAIPQAEEPQAEPARGRRYRGRHGRQRAVFTSGRRR
ncbi:hypothetical protein [Methylobacterium radiodurans]|uniref:Uncharacterized protein n=1 Tax=Methylobacterium radiodurans TaxID=2202828 RepID=A0A2U8VW10_9HYPH|nr:hypothetical protein [Methylobacterium radiodurans]AWN37957.1 hypothetical protein DK427_21320 [Methylobacterium radiodurans]